MKPKTRLTSVYKEWCMIPSDLSHSHINKSHLNGKCSKGSSSHQDATVGEKHLMCLLLANTPVPFMTVRRQRHPLSDDFAASTFIGNKFKF